MIPNRTAKLLNQKVAASMNDSAEILRRAETARAEKSVQYGLRGPIAVNAQILALYSEYRRRAEAILGCIQEVLRASSFRYYRKLDVDVRAFFLKECEAHSSDILTKLAAMPSGGKPSFPEFKAKLDQKLLAEISVAVESYLTHHKEVIRSWWVANGRNFIMWIVTSIGGIIVTLIVKWLSNTYMD